LTGRRRPDHGVPWRVVAALALLVCAASWGRARSRPRAEPTYALAWRAGSQLAPLAVPTGAPEPLLPEGPERETFLDARSVLWRSPGPSRPFALYIAVSGQHWARLYLTRAELRALLDPQLALPALEPGDWHALEYDVDDFLDDHDGDGDPLDAGELHAAGAGLPVLLHRSG
jgi:hypothetical protein